jgi:uncharacterized membrane protein YkoI
MWTRLSASVAVRSLLIHVSELTGSNSDTGGMSPPTRRVLTGLSLIAASLRFAWPARAYDDDDRAEHQADHDSARHAVEHGEALPLADILARVRPELGGEVAGVAFRRKASRWIYEFRVIAPNGRLGEVYVDAATAEIIERESH